MAITFNTTIRTAHANSVVNEAGASAQIKIYTVAPPAAVATAFGGSLLGTITCGSAIGTVASGVITFTGTLTTTAVAGGSALGFRLYKSDGSTGVMDGSVSNTGGSGDLKLDSTTITSGGTITITTAGGVSTITMGG